MRLVGGKYKGRRFNAPQSLKARPTTDFAKEALFNILYNHYDVDFKSIRVLELFGGLGNVAFEWASREVLDLQVLELDFKTVQHLKKVNEDLNAGAKILKQDAYRYLKKINQQFDIVFADPPHDLGQYELIHQLYFDNKIGINSESLLILEHNNKVNFEKWRGFEMQRSYGQVQFSFFKNI